MDATLLPRAGIATCAARVKGGTIRNVITAPQNSLGPKIELKVGPQFAKFLRVFLRDIPCPPPARRSELLALKLALAPSTQETHTLSAALAQQMRGEVRLALERIDASAWLGPVRFTSPHGGNPITIGPAVAEVFQF